MLLAQGSYTQKEKKIWYFYKEMKTKRVAMMSFYLANGHKVGTYRATYKFHTNFMLIRFCTFSLYHSPGGRQGGWGTTREMFPGSSVLMAPGERAQLCHLPSQGLAMSLEWRGRQGRAAGIY